MAAKDACAFKCVGCHEPAYEVSLPAMKFIDAIRSILCEHPSEMTPQEFYDQTKAEYPELYGAETHRRNVDKDYYHNIDHALLAEIYIAARQASGIYSDKSTMTLTLEPAPPSDNQIGAEASDSNENEDLNRLKRFKTCRKRFTQANMVV